ncbi:calcium-binding EF-hand-containing protein [Kalymmatonema gypsitolerans NIES-4073]|nr:calcium-binding EF-hand-containing protein [Scytonema sp. NIES-4073]
MVSELQQRKFTKLFSMYDANNNGVLAKDDFEKIIQKIAELRGWKQGSTEYNTLFDKYIFYWQHIRDAADKNRDDTVTLEEWFAYHEKLLSAKDSYEEQVGTLAALVYDVFDADNDGQLNIKEFEEVFLVYNIPRVFVPYIFSRLDLNGDGLLSKQEVLQLLYEFHFSDDPEAPGNLLFGPY